MTIEELCDRFEAHAEVYYRKPGSGRYTGEHVNFRHALGPVRELFGDLPACELTPGRLRQVRDRMVASGLARGTVNQRIGKIKRVWKWAVSYEMLDARVLTALQAVEALKRGRCGFAMKESRGIAPVAEEDVRLVIADLRRHSQERLAAMLQVMLFTGMRVSEARLMRVRELEIPPERLRFGGDADCWLYCPSEHKTEHHGHLRRIAIGPRAQAVLAPLILLDLEAFVFHPRHSLGSKPYRRDSIRNAVHRACSRLAMAPFTPLQIRHTVATRLRREMSIEAARVTLGHSSASTTEIYAEMDQSLAAAAALRFG